MVRTSKANKKAKISNRYNQVPHPTRDTTWQEHITHKRAKRPAPPKRRPQGHKKQTRQHNKDKHDTQITKMTNKRPEKINGGPKHIVMWIKTHRYLVRMKDP